MRRKIAAAAAALVLPAGLVGVLAIPAGATPHTGPDTSAATADAASPDMMTALQRDLHLTADQARARLAREDKASRTEATLRRDLGASFGGAWLNADATTFTVAVTDAAKAGVVRASGAVPVVVTRSATTLDAAKAKLDRKARPSHAAVPAWYVDVVTNTVVVLARGDSAAARAFASGVDAVRVIPSTEAPTTLYDVRGGDAYYMGGGRCSVGLSVNGGFVTAGHCGTPGTSTQGFNRVAQGSFQGSSFPGNDYAWVSVNSQWVPQPWVNNYSGGNVTVAGSNEAAVGGSICRSGSTTGWHCGVVQQKNATVNYPQGTVTGLTRTNVCAEPGDSGGGWMSGQQGQGVTSGGSGNCSVGGTTYFQPVNEILSRYGLTLRTSGGQNPPPPPPPGPPPPPPPSGCDNPEATYNGSLSGSGAAQIQPNGTWYQSTASGTHRGCLDGPNGVDFDLYLQKWNGAAWANVASGTSAAPDETITYNGTAGYYRYRVLSYSGAGSYRLGITNP